MERFLLALQYVTGALIGGRRGVEVEMGRVVWCGERSSSKADQQVIMKTSVVLVVAVVVVLLGVFIVCGCCCCTRTTCHVCDGFKQNDVCIRT